MASMSCSAKMAAMMLTFMSLFTCFHEVGVHLFVNYARNQEIGLSEAVSNENIESLSGRRTGTLRSAGAVSLNTAHSSPFMSLLLALSIGGKIGKKQVDHSVQPVEKASSLSTRLRNVSDTLLSKKRKWGVWPMGRIVSSQEIERPSSGLRRRENGKIIGTSCADFSSAGSFFW